MDSGSWINGEFIEYGIDDLPPGIHEIRIEVVNGGQTNQDSLMVTIIDPAFILIIIIIIVSVISLAFWLTVRRRKSKKDVAVKTNELKPSKIRKSDVKNFEKKFMEADDFIKMHNFEQGL